MPPPPARHRAMDSESTGPVVRTLVRAPTTTDHALRTAAEAWSRPSSTGAPPEILASRDPSLAEDYRTVSPTVALQSSASASASASRSAVSVASKGATTALAFPYNPSHVHASSSEKLQPPLDNAHTDPDHLPLPTSYDARRAPSSSSGGAHVAEKYGASTMGHPLFYSTAYDLEPDLNDDLHNIDPKNDERNHGISWAGALNLGTLIVLILAVLMLFAGYPIYSSVSKHVRWADRLTGQFGGTNGTGQVPSLPIRPLVDGDTPDSSKTWKNSEDQTFNLVFSDEFNEEGRTFWPGDDPFWEAQDMFYGATNDYEWYSPEAVNTTGGALTITLTQKDTHNLNFQSGMVQSWNKLCFQGGYLEFSLQFPAFPYTQGYWPAAWIMGNLARPGYLGSTDGMWPYSYSSCDTGILPNQTFINQTGPYQALHSRGQWAKHGQLSYLDGMRSPSCTCPGEDHPGPNNTVGRSAPEIDVLEAQVQLGKHDHGAYHTYASESLQTAPFDVGYWWRNTSSHARVYNKTITRINDYHGGVYQEAVSGLTQCPDEGFALTAGKYITYGVEYEPDWNLDGGGYVRWWIDGKPTWRVEGSAIGPVPELDIGQRHIPLEPMSIVMNLGISPGFQPIILNPHDTRGLRFPAQMKYDYVRLYQPARQEPKVSCDPPDYPTAAYINKHQNVYYNPNLTTWPNAWPKNKLTHPGC